MACHAALRCYRRAAMINPSCPVTGRVLAAATSLSWITLQMQRAIAAGRPAVRTARRAGVANPLAAVTVTAGQVNPNKAVARPDWGTRSQRQWPRSATSALHSMPSDQNPGTVAQPGPPSPQWVGTTPWKSVPPDDDPGRDTG